MSTRAETPIAWPGGARFAFTIFDDTDLATRANVSEVYALLDDLELRTTKSVWPLAGTGEPIAGGATCEDRDYLDWTLDLAQRGFEIALHNVTYHTSRREETRAGLDRFRSLYGHDPHTLANHAGNAEALYWGEHRLSGLRRRALALYRRARGGPRYDAHEPSSELFWGDLCRERVRYVRGLTTREVDTLRFCPYLPYHDTARPWVNAWFPSTEAPSGPDLISVLDEAAQDRLAEHGGLCLLYTHFALGFSERGRLARRVVELLKRLRGLGGWYAPVHEVLDHVVASRGVHGIDAGERRALEHRWLGEKVRARLSS